MSVPSSPEQRRAEWFAQFATSIHDPDPPDLVVIPPVCSVCGGELTDDDGWWCDGCAISWSADGTRGGVSCYAAEDEDHPLWSVDTGGKT